MFEANMSAKMKVYMAHQPISIGRLNDRWKFIRSPTKHLFSKDSVDKQQNKW